MRAELLSTANPLTPPAFTSLATGRAPGNHGVFDFIVPRETDDGVFIKLMTGRDVRCETLWSLASRLGRRVTVLNYVLTFPHRPVDGYLVPGFVGRRQLKRAVQPAGWHATLARIPGLDFKELGMDFEREKAAVQGGLPREEYAEWITLHARRERQWARILRWIMEHDPCDLTVVVYDGVDKIQHLAWRFVDPSLWPANPTAWEREIRGLCVNYFRELDGHIRETVELAGPDTRVFIVSDHGFGPSVEVVYLNTWLHQHGYLHWGDATSPDSEEGILVRTMKLQYRLLDWAKTTAYALMPSCNGIYIRVADRPGRVGIRPAEYEGFRRDLAEKLTAFRDPATGERVIRSVMTREEAFPGRFVRDAPDLTLVLRDYGLISVLRSERSLVPRTEPRGMHRAEGIFVAAGAGIRRGVQVPPLSIVDVTPALVHSLGLAVPSDFEGRFPGEVFDDAFLATSPPVRGEPTQPVDHGDPDPAPAAPTMMEQEERVLDRLRALGYVE